jgi:hypothetical protein
MTDDDYAYPDSRDALLQAITLPRTDTYTATVAGFNGTSGDYTIQLSNGFADLAYQDDFDEPGGWAALSENTQVRISGGTLNTAISSSRAHDAVSSGAVNLADAATRIDILDVNNPSGWIVGLIARQQGNDNYLYEVNSEGRWRFSLVENGEAEIIHNAAPPSDRPSPRGARAASRRTGRRCPTARRCS